MSIRDLTIASTAGMAVAFGVYCWRRHTELEREVAERKKAQEALRQNELRLRALVANAPVVLFALDGDGVITASEGQGLKAFGREQNELVGQSIFDLYRDKPMVLELARRALAGEEIDTAIELAGVTLGMKSFSHRDETGKVSGVVGVGIDVTERRQAEKMRAAQTRQATLRAEMSVALARGGGLRDILQQCAEAMVRHFDAALARIWTFDGEEDVLELRASAGLYTDLGGPMSRVPLGERIGRAAQKRRPFVTNDIQSVPEFGGKEWAAREGLVATANYPLIVEDRLVGAIAVFARKPLPDDMLETMSLVSDAIAQGIKRKQAEEELRDSEERLRTVIGNVPVVLFAVDREGVFKLSEGKGLEGLALEPGEVVGRSVFEVFRDEPQILENTRRALSGEEFSATVDLAGSTFETRYSQLRDEGGEVAGVIGVAADVTERERAVERLEESEERYRAIIEQTIDSVYLGNVDTKRLIESNTAFRQMLGYTAEELRGMRIYDFIAHEEEDIDAVYQSVLEAGQRFIGERRYRRKDGTLLEVEVSATVVSYGGERVICTVARDITERKEFEEKLLETNRRLEELAVLKADFTAMVAHELYSPLVTARGYLDMLTTGELEPTEQRHALDGMRSELEMLGALVADVRVAATIEREDFAIRACKIPVSALLDDAVAFAGMLPGDHRLFIKAEAREQEVWADRYRVGQVLRNLLSNAAKYSHDGAPIELRTMVDGDHVCVEVADRGPGVHPDDAARIFDKFGRGRDLSGSKVAGVGVGLYLSRRIMKAHGGDLMMDSMPGAGSVFGFKLQIIR